MLICAGPCLRLRWWTLQGGNTNGGSVGGKAVPLLVSSKLVA